MRGVKGAGSYSLCLCIPRVAVLFPRKVSDPSAAELETPDPGASPWEAQLVTFGKQLGTP